LGRLLIKDPEKRLGSGADGFNNIMNHPWFGELNWEALVQKKIKAPYIP
jgi:hypothetical protein